MHVSATTGPQRPPIPLGSSEGLLDVSVVIVNYNVCEFLEQALRSLQRAAEGLRVEVFVVDNGSVDGSVEMVRAQFPDVHLITNTGNLGFARANNQAICQARGRFLLILNPDTILQEDTLRTLVAFMERHPEAGAAGCTILNPDGSFALESRRAFPTPSVAFYRLIGLSHLFPHNRRFGQYNLTYLPQDEVAEIDALSGSCMLVRHAALYYSREEAYGLPQGDGEAELLPFPIAGDQAGHGAGLLDEDFFMYGEDLDWCYRIQQAGWKVFYTPETRLIHYKGESTKKGELRYVKLFYGAMSQFTEKHFHSRYSRLFAALLQAGIVVRAALSILGSAFIRMRAPMLDFLLALCVVLLVGKLRSLATGVTFSAIFYAAVAPAYALSVVCGIAASRGYRRSDRRRLRAVLTGAATGFVTVACASFFLKDVAFSRAVVLFSFPLIAMALLAVRLTQAARKTTPRRAILVGPRVEAERFRSMLSENPARPFELLGYVDREVTRGRRRQTDALRLGSLHQLRDLVRIRRVDDVIFAAAGLPNDTIFSLMQQLSGLPVQFKILAEGGQRVIGKASVENLMLPSLVAVNDTPGGFRTWASCRIFEITVALIGLATYPVVYALARASRKPGYTRLAVRLRYMPSVLAGSRRLIGFDPGEASFVPGELGLEPGVFAVTESLPASRASSADVARAYRFYAVNRSAALDLDILIQTLRTLVD